ncbi:Putative ribonuclease H protein At1g65750 [Linum grandiflorum]
MKNVVGAILQRQLLVASAMVQLRPNCISCGIVRLPNQYGFQLWALGFGLPSSKKIYMIGLLKLRLRVFRRIVGVQETMKVGTTLSLGDRPHRQEALIGWKAPTEDWIAINTDGSVIQPGNQAAGGGVLRDSQGRVLCAFTANFGSCSITRAELRAALHGISLAWEKSYRKIHLQMDSSCALSFLLGDPPYDARHKSCIIEVRLIIIHSTFEEITVP